MTEIEAVTATWRHLRGCRGFQYELLVYWRDRKDNLEAAEQKSSEPSEPCGKKCEELTARIDELQTRVQASYVQLRDAAQVCRVLHKLFKAHTHPVYSGRTGKTCP